jgi:hypothetical protein
VFPIPRLAFKRVTSKCFFANLSGAGELQRIMNQHRWQWLPIGLIVAGVIGVVVAAAANATRLGWWQAIIYAGCVAAIGATLLFRRKLTVADVELETLRQRLADDQNRLGVERSQFEELRISLQQELTQSASRLDKREQALADRLVTYHEWMEFPQPLDLKSSPREDAKLEDLARQDRQLQELLKAETQVLYDNILQNKYAAEGKVLLSVIRDDILTLVTRVARIYQPTIEQPLLEASLARVFRAISRASLQMLVVLDELPVDVKQASLSTLHGYVRSAVKTWRMYKSAEPYWPYVNTAYYLGRFALGANPLALGAWWFVGNLGSRGAQAVAKHLIDRQALALLSHLVRVIGYEVAGIYGGDFRHRDANWIYATELTELVSQFPLSRDSLAHALREIGALELRSEYDRIFLYRCLASGKSAGAGRYAASVVLTMDERRAVATRLERFLDAFVHGKSADRMHRWKKAAEGRLGIKLSIVMKSSAMSVREQLVDATRSLGSFLVATKQLEPSETAKLLADTAIVRELPAEERSAVLASLSENTSFFFEHPDLDPDGNLVDKYLDDLAALHARTAPRAAEIEETLEDVAAYLRRPAKQMRMRIEQSYAAALAERLPSEFPQRRISLAAARAALDLLADPMDEGRFLYGPVKLEWPEGVKSEIVSDGTGWLLGIDRRLLLFTSGNQPRVIWQANPRDVHAEATRQLLTTSCRLTGGQWLLAGHEQPLAIRVNATLVASYGTYFRPLLAMLGRAAGEADEPAVATR